jgi:hypothetical protein
MNNLPLRSRSSLFVERWAGAERQSVRLGLTVYLLGALCAVLALSLVYVAARPKPVHYVPAAAGVSWPGRVPPASVISFACAWLMNWTNYSPGTVEDVYERSLVFLAPAFLAKVKAGLDAELQKVSREKISSVFTLKNEPRLSERTDGFRVVFEGERGIYVGREEMTREGARFTVDVRPVYPTESNPYGLAVVDVVKEKVSDETP